MAGISQREAEEIARDLEALPHCSDQVAIICINRVLKGDLTLAH